MDAEQIAAGLSAAQKDHFLHPMLAKGWFYKGLLGKTSIAMPAGCIEHVTTRPGYQKYYLTETGLAVRAILESRND